MENEEFLGPKTGHRSGPEEARGWPVWSLDSNGAVLPPESADYPSIPTIPGLIGVTAHHLCTTLLTTKTSE